MSLERYENENLLKQLYKLYDPLVKISLGRNSTKLKVHRLICLE